MLLTEYLQNLYNSNDVTIVPNLNGMTNFGVETSNTTTNNVGPNSYNY